jgi:hypothetical protein
MKHVATPNEVHLLPEPVVSEEAPWGEFTYGRPICCRADCIRNYSTIYPVIFYELLHTTHPLIKINYTSKTKEKLLPYKHRICKHIFV